MIDRDTMEQLYKSYMAEITPATGKFYSFVSMVENGYYVQNAKGLMNNLRQEVLNIVDKHLDKWKKLGILKNYSVGYKENIGKVDFIFDIPDEYFWFFEKYFPGTKDLNKCDK